jgi:uncharacterized protein YqgV (UPF0045/DUF77 family)
VAVTAAFSIAPSGSGTVGEDGSVSTAVAEVVRIVRASGLPNETNAMFTNVEGTLQQVLDLIDVRRGHEGALRHKVEAVERRLAGDCAEAGTGRSGAAWPGR